MMLCTHKYILCCRTFYLSCPHRGCAIIIYSNLRVGVNSILGDGQRSFGKRTYKYNYPLFAVCVDHVIIITVFVYYTCTAYIIHDVSRVMRVNKIWSWSLYYDFHIQNESRHFFVEKINVEFVFLYSIDYCRRSNILNICYCGLRF